MIKMLFQIDKSFWRSPIWFPCCYEQEEQDLEPPVERIFVVSYPVEEEENELDNIEEILQDIIQTKEEDEEKNPVFIIDDHFSSEHSQHPEWVLVEDDAF